jgi:hypothetical protein
MDIKSFIYQSVIATINYIYTVADTTSCRLFYDGNESSYCTELHNNWTTADGQ